MSEILKLVTDEINNNDKELSYLESRKEKLLNELFDVQGQTKSRLQKREKLQQEFKNYYEKLQQWPVHYNEKCAASSLRPFNQDEHEKAMAHTAQSANANTETIRVKS